MSNLVLELRPGEMMIVNGAPIRFRTKTRIELTSKARFLFGKQVMSPEQADSPARRIYFALQSAYVGPEGQRAAGMGSVRELVAAFQAATTSRQARDVLDRALGAAEADDCYAALKLARRIIRHEAAAMSWRPPMPMPTASAARPMRSVPIPHRQDYRSGLVYRAEIMSGCRLVHVQVNRLFML